MGFDLASLRDPDEPTAPQESRPGTCAALCATAQNFKRLILFLAYWNFAANLAAPFFTVYMLKRRRNPLAPLEIVVFKAILAETEASSHHPPIELPTKQAPMPLL
jgi:hypothetical protein